MEGGLLPRLLPLLHDAHAVVATKALLALSCCVRGYPPALLWLRQQGGLATLVQLAAEQGGEPRLQRKCLQVLQYMLLVVPLDRRAACEAGMLPALRWGAAGRVCVICVPVYCVGGGRWGVVVAAVRFWCASGWHRRALGLASTLHWASWPSSRAAPIEPAAASLPASISHLPAS
jgi:hypothetical protein